MRDEAIRARRPATGATIRVGVVGGGLIAQLAHLPYLSELGARFRVEALAEPAAPARDVLSRRYGLPRAFADHRAMLDAAAVDAVVVCSPNATHADVVLDALAAGVHVLVEKPLCLSPADAARIATARDRAGLVVQVAYMKRFDPAYEALLDDLPEPVALRHLTSLTYDPGLAGPFAPPDLAVSDGGSGFDAERILSEVFLGALVHDVNLVHGLLERLGVPLRARIADAFAAPDGSACGGTVELDGGLRWTMAWLRIDGLHDFREHLGLYAADGVRTLDFPAPYLRQAPTVYARSTGRGGRNEQRAVRSWEESYLRQLVHFHECVTGAADCRTPPEQALRDIELLTELHRAATA